ncbi:MAG: hypothetical protein WCD37_06500 [Chloroflexia bacterium]
MQRLLQGLYAEFLRRYEALRESGLRGENLDREALIVVLELYFARNKTIRTYIECFESYEGLLQRIYWLLSHVAFYERISCIATDNVQQLQQALLICGEETYLTAVAPTLARTLRTSQLVHITMPEVGHLHDGIFQIERWNLDWDVGTDARIYIRADQQWKTTLPVIAEAIGSTTVVFIASDETPLVDVVNDFSFTFLDEHGHGEPTRLRDISWTMSKDESLTYP